jgi:hypothetical protein
MIPRLLLAAENFDAREAMGALIKARCLAWKETSLTFRRSWRSSHGKSPMPWPRNGQSAVEVGDHNPTDGRRDQPATAGLPRFGLADTAETLHFLRGSDRTTRRTVQKRKRCRWTRPRQAKKTLAIFG